MTTASKDYSALASKESLDRTVASLSANGFLPEVVESKADALAKIKSLVPKGASVMNGSSRTLEEIGFVDYLKSGTHGWNNVHETILAETDKEKQATLRKTSVLSDVYVGSVHALSETGELLIASNTGSQLPHIVFTSGTVIFVIGAQKIVSNIQSALDRLEKHVIPLEDVRLMGVYKVHTMHSKSVILHKENSMMGRKVHVLIVNESLGF